VWSLIHYNPLLDDQGRVIRWYATGTDINNRVEAEERTRNENLVLRERIDRDSMFEDIVGSSDALRKVLHQAEGYQKFSRRMRSLVPRSVWVYKTERPSTAAVRPKPRGLSMWANVIRSALGRLQVDPS
jgi:hypothetical protein